MFYGLFATINLLISINLLNQVDMIALDMQTLAPKDISNSHLVSYLLQDELSFAKPVLVVTHFIMGLMVLAGIFIPSKSDQ